MLLCRYEAALEAPDSRFPGSESAHLRYGYCAGSFLFSDSVSQGTARGSATDLWRPSTRNSWSRLERGTTTSVATHHAGVLRATAVRKPAIGRDAVSVHERPVRSLRRDYALWNAAAFTAEACNRGGIGAFLLRDSRYEPVVF